MRKSIAMLLAALMLAALCMGCGEKEAYEAAKALENEGNYAEAAAAYEAIGDYEDAAERAAYCTDYLEARTLEDAGKYAEAEEAFKALKGFADAATRAANCVEYADYAAAYRLLMAYDYAGAQKAFGALGDFRRSAKLAETCAEATDAGYYACRLSYVKQLASGSMEFFADTGEGIDGCFETKAGSALYCVEQPVWAAVDENGDRQLESGTVFVRIASDGETYYMALSPDGQYAMVLASISFNAGDSTFNYGFSHHPAYCFAPEDAELLFGQLVELE